MGYRLFLFFAISVSTIFAQDLSPQDWAKAMVEHEIQSLDSAFKEAVLQGTLPPQKLAGVQTLTRDLKLQLSGTPDEETLKAASLKYLALTDYLAFHRLKGLSEAGKSLSAELLAAQAKADQMLATLQKASLQTQAERDAFLPSLQAVEASTEAAQKQILLQKRSQSLRGAVLRLELLASLEPARRDDYMKAAQALRDAMARAASDDEQGSDDRVALALGTAFGKLAETWDGRHLWHYAQLRSMALVLLRSDSLSAAEKSEVKTALDALLASADSDDYDAALAEFQEITTRLITDHQLNETDSDLVLYTAPDQVQESLVQRLQAMKKWIPEIRKSYLDNETWLQSWRTGDKRTTLAMLDGMAMSFERAAKTLEANMRASVLERFHHSANYLQMLTMFTAEAILDRSGSASLYREAWGRGMSRMEAGQPFMTDDDYQQVRNALKIERREGIRRAWLNRHNAKVAGLSVLLAAEAIAIPFTGGGSAAAMPATLSAVMTVSVVSAKALVVTTAALDIADRTKIKGVKGLVNMDTAFDALLILSLSPRPMVGGAPATTTMGRLGQAGMRRLAEIQYSSGVLLAGGATAYGGYLIYNAETIAEDMRRDGVQITAAEIRRKGLVNVAMGILALQQNASYYQRGVAKNGEGFRKAMEPATLSQGSIPRFIGQLRQFKTLKDYYTKNPGLVGKMMTVTKGLGYATMDFLLLTEAALFSYTNLDSRYLNKTAADHPLPDLKDDETAVVLVGFEPADYFLYAGALAPYSNRQEVRKYGKKLYTYTFQSPEHLMQVLAEHREKHGPVRYLKISTHGRPGRLFTAAIAAPPEAGQLIQGDGWIDAFWLSQNARKLKAQAGRIFAADARIRLFACLVGANLDTDDGEGTQVGEKFIQALGDTWLVNGGAIDASTRVLLGLDSTAGALYNHAMQESLKPTSVGRPQLVLPVTPLNLEEWGGEDQEGAPWKQEMASTLESAKAMGKRLVGIFAHWPPVWWEYGVNLEGPFWQSRYRYAEFPGQAH